MSIKRLTLSHEDYRKLVKLLDALRVSGRLNSPHLLSLRDEVANALIMDEDVMPRDRVTLYSRVQYTDLRDGSLHEASIVFPAEKDESRFYYSILTPLGTSLIGEERKSVTTCYAPIGEIPLRVENVFPRNRNEREENNAGTYAHH